MLGKDLLGWKHSGTSLTASGPAPGAVLRGELLGADAADVREWGQQSGLDGRAGHCDAGREATGLGPASGRADRRGAATLGRRLTAGRPAFRQPSAPSLNHYSNCSFAICSKSPGLR
jgi:hypothetical protein